ncbi:acetylxylan esterase [Streptomyces longwoodensis]|uniref:acetylxylan esterase n=1 Tax=Streptomyces longwoodensis TaxID=68231 RepID=UPI0033C07C27
MAIIDLTEDQLADYDCVREEPADFDAFWAGTLDLVRPVPLDPVFTPYPTALAELDVLDVEFAGWNGDRIKGWFLAPRHLPGPLPCVVEFIGYGCGRATPYQWLTAPAAGFATLVMDNRGQGGSLPADTPDPDPDPARGSSASFLLRGADDPDRHYYRRLTTDAVRAVEVARAHPRVDADRVAVLGGSQGGGLALAAAGLTGGLAAVVAQQPFLCHYRRATQATDSHPYFEITRYLRTNPDRVERTFRTLSYFDSVNHAARITAPTLVTVPLMDDVCPPTTTMAAHRHCGAAEKELKVWPYGNHSGGEMFGPAAAFDFLVKHLAG